MFLPAVLFCLSLTSIAQRAVYITIDGNTIPVDHLLMNDSVAGGKVYYSASFVLPVTDDPAFQFIYQALQKGNVNVSVFYTRSAGTTTERQYRSIALQQMQLSKLEAAGRTACKLEVKMRSGQVVEKANATVAYKGNKGRQVLVSNYTVSLDNLPAGLIAGIGNVEFKNNALLSFEVSARNINEWNQWFSSPGKKINGSIFLLAPNMRDKLIQIRLTNAELVSVTQNITVNDERLERFVAVVKVANVSM